MKLTSVLDPDMVFCGLEGENRESLYRSMLEKVLSHTGIDQKTDILLNEIMNRENGTMIPYEMGIALPHVRKADFKDLHIAVGILKNPVLLKENDKAPSQLIVMSLISEATSSLYLKMLAAFSRFAVKPGNMEATIKCETPSEFIKLLNDLNVKVKQELTAEDVMTRDFPTIQIDTPISDALDIFTRESKHHLPVVDASGKFLGMLNASAILSKYIPEYILMMDNVKFLTSFEPFEKVLKEERNLKVNSFVQEAKIVMSLDAPLIQLTANLVKNQGYVIVVTDESKTLKGIVTIQDIIQKVLRG